MKGKNFVPLWYHNSVCFYGHPHLRKERDRVEHLEIPCSILLASADHYILDLNVPGVASVTVPLERSPALEFLNQLLGILGVHALQLELEADKVEQRYIRAHRHGAMHLAVYPAVRRTPAAGSGA